MIFKDEDKLNKMLYLRRQGWTYISLGLLFGVDHSSIYKWCLIKQIPVPKHSISIKLSDLLELSGVTQVEKHEKSYQDYLNDEKKRRYPKMYHVLANV